MPLESYSTAEILVTGRQRLEKPLLWMVWLGTLSFSITVGSVLYVIASTLAVGVNMLAVRENKELYVHHALVNAGVLLATAMAAFEFWTRSDVALVIIGRYMVLIQLCKLFERKRTRDYIQLLALNMLLVVTTALRSTSPWFALVVLAYMVLACYVLMVFTLKRGLDEAASRHLRSETGPMAPQRVAWNVVRGWPGKALRRLLLSVMIPSLVIGVSAFLLMPRAADVVGPLASGLFGRRFADDVRLGGGGQLYESDAVVMHVRVSENGKTGEARGDAARYLRRKTYDTYVNSTWRKHDPQYIDVERMRPSPDLWAGELGVRHEIEIKSQYAKELPVPYYTVDIRVDGSSEPRLASDLTYELASTPRQATVAYQTRAFDVPLRDVQRNYLARMAATHPGRSSQAMSLPPDARDRILALAREWAGDLLDERRENPARADALNLQLARRLAGQLRKRCTYSLDLNEADPTRDGVDDFLFHMRKGHCEYFASALAVMCRLLDVPTRVAVGFTLSEYDAEAGRYVVRERDAHAWCEVFAPSAGWVLVDPTPGSDRMETARTGWWQAIRDVFQDLRFSWIRHVIGYEESHRQEIRGGALEWLGEVWQRLLDGIASVKASLRRLLQEGIFDRVLVRFMVGLMALAVLVFALIVLKPLLRHYRQRRSQLRGVRSGRLLPPVQRLMQALARQGLARPAGETLREFLPQAASRFGLSEQDLRTLAEIQYRWRWGHHEPTSEEMQAAGQCASRLTAQLGKTAP